MVGMQIYPDDRLAIAVLSNVENGPWARWGEAVATLVFGGDAEPPVSPPTQALSAKTLNAFVGLYEGGGWRADVRLEDGHLWAYWNNFPTGKYLKPSVSLSLPSHPMWAGSGSKMLRTTAFRASTGSFLRVMC